MPRHARWVVAALAATALLPSSSRADSLFLTSPGAVVTANGALFYQTNTQPTGTGVIDPFVRIQRTGTESGYNTDGQIEFDTKDTNNWTRSLPLNSLQAVTIGGVQYYQFLLDINEAGSDTKRRLSLNEVQVYLGDSPSLSGFKDGTGFAGHSKPVYDLDGAGAKTIELDYKLNGGSGSGDMFMYVPTSLFTQYDTNKYGYVYLYSAFGQPNGSDAGFEEWAALKKTSTQPPPPNGVPAPPGLVLAGMGLGCLLLGRFRTRRATAGA
jgi:hypothetical protein